MERSSDQVIKPVNLEALTKWVGHLPPDVVRDVAEVAPMLSVLGYDPNDPKPSYGQPDPRVADNTRLIAENRNLWADRAKTFLDQNGGSSSSTAKPSAAALVASEPASDV